MPSMGKAAAEILKRKPKIATNQMVEVVPSVAPTIIPTACVKVTNPALTKPITVIMAAVEDCITAVKMAPETTALKRLDTSRCIARRSESPASPFRPSVRWWIPSRNRPSPPRSVTVEEVVIDCVQILVFQNVEPNHFRNLSDKATICFWYLR